MTSVWLLSDLLAPCSHSPSHPRGFLSSHPATDASLLQRTSKENTSGREERPLPTSESAAFPHTWHGPGNRISTKHRLHTTFFDVYANLLSPWLGNGLEATSNARCLFSNHSKLWHFLVKNGHCMWKINKNKMRERSAVLLGSLKTDKWVEISPIQVS